MKTQSQNQIDGRTFAIGILSVTACILLVGLMLVLITPTTGYAIGTSDRSGDYVMITQQLTSSNEGVLVIDAAAKRGILYGYDYNRKQLKLLAGIPLDRLRKPPTGN